MASVKLDIEEMSRFALRLDATAKDCRDKNRQIHAEFMHLKEVWRDRKFSEFSKVFEETARELNEFQRDCEIFAQYLRQHVALARKVQDTRFG